MSMPPWWVEPSPATENSAMQYCPSLWSRMRWCYGIERIGLISITEQLVEGWGWCHRDDDWTWHSISSSNRKCVKSSDIINSCLWVALTGNSSFIGNNCKPQSLAWRRFNRLPKSFGQDVHIDIFSVEHVRTRA